MTGNKWLLSNILPYGLDSVTFEDYEKGSVMVSGSLNVPSLLKLRDVPFVDRLFA